MPTYEYECEGCNHSFEEFQNMSDKPLRKCPKCGKPRLHRLIGSGAGIIFKGSGFYETDYKRKEQPKPASDSPSPAPTPAPAGDKAASPGTPAGSDSPKPAKAS